MRKLLHLSILFISFFFLSNPVFCQTCPYVVSNSFSASEVNVDGSCTWTITFDINVDSGDKNSLVYSLVAEDLDNATSSFVNADLDCDYSGMISPGVTVIETYTGSCNVIFYLDWKSYDVLDCIGDPCDLGSETTLVPTPVELIDFIGVPKNDMVELNWSTESELNNRYFEIQRSTDGRSFENIGWIEGNGTTEVMNYYTFIDKHALPFAYYRLKQVDYDGKFEFSQIINVKRGDFQSKLLAYPTEAFNEVTLRLETLDSRKSYLKIANASGHIMHDETYYSTTDTEYLNLDIQNYPPGIYFVSLSNKTETVTTKFVVVGN